MGAPRGVVDFLCSSTDNTKRVCRELEIKATTIKTLNLISYGQESLTKAKIFFPIHNFTQYPQSNVNCLSQYENSQKNLKSTVVN